MIIWIQRNTYGTSYDLLIGQQLQETQRSFFTPKMDFDCDHGSSSVHESIRSEQLSQSDVTKISPPAFSQTIFSTSSIRRSTFRAEIPLRELSFKCFPGPQPYSQLTWGIIQISTPVRGSSSDFFVSLIPSIRLALLLPTSSTAPWLVSDMIIPPKLTSPLTSAQ